MSQTLMEIKTNIEF